MLEDIDDIEDVDAGVDNASLATEDQSGPAASTPRPDIWINRESQWSDTDAPGELDFDIPVQFEGEMDKWLLEAVTELTAARLELL